jgi:alkanesulfonate monooxygenase SsuD/methylene tetrahydromethanopterin reductase-like flavin-dependent oxidoreductase (luciferase family)
MRHGLDIHIFGDFADVRVIAELAKAVEAGGWDGFFIWDHIGIDQPTADVTVALAAIALATERIRFGPMVTPLPRRRVQKVAREFASLDRLSNGRTVLGVGLGFPPEMEYAAFGEPASDRTRAERLDESLEVLTELWRGGPVDFDGSHLHVHTKVSTPGPVQAPRIPIWVAGSWPGARRAFRRAARYDGVYPMPSDIARGMTLTVDEISAMREVIGRDDDFDIVVTAPPDGDPRAYEHAGATWWLEVCTAADEAFTRAAAGPTRSD